MNCPKCHQCCHIKNGIIRGIQRYKCKLCGKNYTVSCKSTAKMPEEKRLGLLMYLEGLGLNIIGQLLGVSHVAVIKWIKKYGNHLQEIKNDKPILFVDIDEIQHYMQSSECKSGFGIMLIEEADNTLVALWENGEKSFKIKS